jgi:hypothetical protein
MKPNLTDVKVQISSSYNGNKYQSPQNFYCGKSRARYHCSDAFGYIIAIIDIYVTPTTPFPAPHAAPPVCNLLNL